MDVSSTFFAKMWNQVRECRKECRLRHNPASVEAKAEQGCIRKGLRWEHPCQEDLLVLWTLTDRMLSLERSSRLG